MRDYEILRKALMDAWRGQYCSDCELNSLCHDDDSNCYFKQAADAIEELLKENAELDNSGRVLMAAFARLKEKVPHWISVGDAPKDADLLVGYFGGGDGLAPVLNQDGSAVTAPNFDAEEIP